MKTNLRIVYYACQGFGKNYKCVSQLYAGLIVFQNKTIKINSFMAKNTNAKDL